MKDEQGQVFFNTEGDAWFDRNARALKGASPRKRDLILRILESAGDYRPQEVLEVGCANGWRLAALRERYGCAVTGVEPSAKAIEEGRRLYGAAIQFQRGLSRDLPADDEKFDLVIASFVFHWVSRDAFLRSVAEIDRVLVPGGLVIVQDFFPDFQSRRRYHHIQDGGTFTFKQEIAAAFTGTGLYRHIARVTSGHGNDSEGLFSLHQIASDDRICCDVLEKDVAAYAVTDP